jgi:hypothetical protein
MGRAGLAGDNPMTETIRAGAGKPSGPFDAVSGGLRYGLRIQSAAAAIANPSRLTITISNPTP